MTFLSLILAIENVRDTLEQEIGEVEFLIESAEKAAENIPDDKILANLILDESKEKPKIDYTVTQDGKFRKSIIFAKTFSLSLVRFLITGLPDIALFIFTSGTTGLPKPAVIKHSRFYGAGIALLKLAMLKEKDIVYVSLPIYHASGAFLGIGSALVLGATVVLRKKFSASNFWKDCIKYNCTSFIYIGEICRFLVNQPASPLDRQHKIRKAIGNGLRMNVWKEFHERFGIDCVEFYASSEGNCNMSKLNEKW